LGRSRAIPSEEEWLKMSKVERKDLFKKFELVGFLYDDLIVSVVGLAFSLLGTLLLFVGH
jgi:hypothetical protein